MERRKDGVFLWDVEELTFLIITHLEYFICPTNIKTGLRGFLALISIASLFSKRFW